MFTGMNGMDWRLKVRTVGFGLMVALAVLSALCVILLFVPNTGNILNFKTWVVGWLLGFSIVIYGLLAVGALLRTPATQIAGVTVTRPTRGDIFWGFALALVGLLMNAFLRYLLSSNPGFDDTVVLWITGIGLVVNTIVNLLVADTLYS